MKLCPCCTGGLHNGLVFGSGKVVRVGKSQILKFGANFFQNFLEFLKSQKFSPTLCQRGFGAEKNLDHETGDKGQMGKEGKIFENLKTFGKKPLRNC